MVVFEDDYHRGDFRIVSCNAGLIRRSRGFVNQGLSGCRIHQISAAPNPVRHAAGQRWRHTERFVRTLY
jgi:hypothetical protein